VPAAVGLDNLDVVLPGQSPMHDDRIARRDRRGKGVDDQQNPHRLRRYQPIWQGTETMPRQVGRESLI
jgi:hypothetical protein